MSMHRERTEEGGNGIALVAVGKTASAADSSWLPLDALNAETRLDLGWPGSGGEVFKLRRPAFLRLVIADELDDNLIGWLEATREAEPEWALLVVVTDSPLSICVSAAQRLRAPVLNRFHGATFEDAIRVWFNPMALPGLVGFGPADMTALAGQAAVGWVTTIHDRASLESARWCVGSANAWLIDLATESLMEAHELLSDLQEATHDKDAAMFCAGAIQEPGRTRNSLAVLFKSI